MASRHQRHARIGRRRHLLQLGTAGLSGVLGTAASATASGLTPRADRCIVLFLNGGPSHLDMWDLKPDAPSEIRGEFQPIDSSLPGVSLSEHLPRLAQHMHRTTLIRSMNHSVNNSHAAAVYAALTGHDRGELGGGAQPTDLPRDLCWPVSDLLQIVLCRTWPCHTRQRKVPPGHCNPVFWEA